MEKKNTGKCIKYFIFCIKIEKWLWRELINTFV